MNIQKQEFLDTTAGAGVRVDLSNQRHQEANLDTNPLA